MNELGQREIGEVPPDTPFDADALIASLRAAGADRFDPVRWHYIDVLAKRGMAHQGSVKRMLDAKLAQVLAVFKERFDRAQCDARDAAAQATERYPHAANDLQHLFAAGDFNGLQRLVATLRVGEQNASLRALVHQLEQHSPANTGTSLAGNAGLDGNTGSRPELKTVRHFRNTFSKLSVAKQVAQELKQAPKNAGPINSHMLVLRSLALMRDISPDYLNRFMSYAETLLCLDHCEKEKPDNPKKPQTAKTAKK